MKDLSGNPLPLEFITESTHNQVISAVLLGNKFEIYNHWLASGHTLDVMKVNIDQKEGASAANPSSDGVDMHGNPLPFHIPKAVHDVVFGKINTGDCMEAYQHWIASGHTLVLYKNRLNVVPTPPTVNYSDRVISKFLWKPVAEGGGGAYTGKPVVMVNLPDVVIKINGKETKNVGLANGWASTCRFNGPKCNELTMPVKVEFFEKDGRPIKTKKGEAFEIIEKPCEREEWKK